MVVTFYCASASQMFHVPVEKHGINGHLRQKGKIAELALGYGGSVGALKAMGALEMGLTEDELQPLVNAWRQSNPKYRSSLVGLRYSHQKCNQDALQHCLTRYQVHMAQWHVIHYSSIRQKAHLHQASYWREQVRWRVRNL